MVSCRLPPSPSLQANLLDEFQSMRQPVCVCSAAVYLPIALHQELSTRLLFLGNQHVRGHVMFLGISKEHTDENPIKHRNRRHAVVTFCLMSYYSLGNRYNKGMLYCLTASLNAGTSDDMMAFHFDNCWSKRPRKSLKTSYCCAVGALSA